MANESVAGKNQKATTGFVKVEKVKDKRWTVMHGIIHKINKEQLKTDIPVFSIGDTVKVHTKIIEGGKERIQVFQGTVIARQGSDINEAFTVRRVAYGQGIERVFPLHSPRIAKIERMTEGKVRRAKLYYLRDRVGKAARVKTKLRTNKKK